MWYRLLKDINWKILCLTMAFILTAYINDLERRKETTVIQPHNETHVVQPIEKPRKNFWFGH